MMMSNIVTVDIADKPKNFSEVLRKNAQHRSNHIAIIEPDRNISLTYSELDNIVDRAVVWLESQGVSKGSVVSVALRNCIEYFPIYLGVIRLGAIINPFPVTLSGHDLVRNLQYTEPILVICHDIHSSFVREYDFRVFELIIDEQSQFFEYLTDFSLNENSNNNVLNDDFAACLYYSSGTTDDPKGILYSHSNMVCLIDSIVRSFHHDQSDKHLVLLPLGHTASINYSFLPSLYTGATIILYDSFLKLRNNLWEVIDKFKISYMQVVPSVLYSILNTPYINFDSDKTQSLSYIGCGSAPLSIHMQSEFKKKYGIPVANLYGLSETGPTHFDDPLDPKWMPGSIGVPLDVNSVDFIDENGNTVPIGEVGEIIVKGPNVFVGYFKNENLYNDVVCNGYFHTGDLGYIDDEGLHYFVDRKKDLIIKAGVNIHPGEIEEVLYEHNLISEVLVIGVPDEYYGEDIKCFAVMINSDDEEDVIKESVLNFARDRLGLFKAPKSIQIVDALPKGPSGKYLRRSLREV